MAPTCHKMAPRPPQEPQGGPKTTPRGAKLAPRQPQDNSKTAPSRFHSGSVSLFFLVFLLLWAILLPTYPQLASKMPSCWPSCLQDGSKLLPRPQLGPNLAQLGSSWAHLGLPLQAKMNISCERYCILGHFGDTRLKTSKVASKWPRDATR